MSDENLGMTGKDVTVEMTIDGVPFQIAGAITNLEETPQFADVDRKHLGTPDVDVDKVPTGWEGSMTVTAKTPAVADALDAYRAARRNRIPVAVSIDVQQNFRNGEVRNYTYICVQFTADTKTARDDAVEYSISWKSGTSRITA